MNSSPQRMNSGGSSKTINNLFGVNHEAGDKKGFIKRLKTRKTAQLRRSIPALFASKSSGGADSEFNESKRSQSPNKTNNLQGQEGISLEYSIMNIIHSIFIN